MAEQPIEATLEVKNPIDRTDIVFGIGLGLLGIGLWGAFSFWVALTVIGAILIFISGLSLIVSNMPGKLPDA